MAASCASSEVGSLTGAFQELRQVPWERKEAALQVLMKLLGNVVASPENPKFRCIRRTNATLQEKVFSVPGCTSILQAAGFVSDGDEMKLPEGCCVSIVYDEFQKFNQQETMTQLRVERDAKLEAMRVQDKKPTSGSAKPSQATSSDVQQLDRKERGKLENVQREALAEIREQKADAFRDALASGFVPGITIIKKKEEDNRDPAWKDNGKKTKKKKKHPSKGKQKGKGKGKGGGGRASNPKSHGYKLGGATPDDHLGESTRQDVVAYATLSRIGTLEQRTLVQIEQRREAEAQALARYNIKKPTRSQLLAREVQKEQARRIALGCAETLPSLHHFSEIVELLLHPVPGDNSCLFHAVGYLTQWANCAPPLAPSTLRSMVADQMLQDPERWSEVTVAEKRTVDEYVAWISSPASWGGFIDLIALSECLHVQISVLSIESLYWTHYPDDKNQYDRRIYLMYNGVHFDAVVGRTSDSEVRLFDPADETTMSRIELLGSQQQFQEAAIYVCQQCGLALVGSAEVTRHSFDTAHCEFAEAGSDTDDCDEEEEQGENEGASDPEAPGEQES